MKACFLTDDPSPIGGGPTHLQRIAKILRQKYHYQVDVVNPKTMDKNFDVSSFDQRVKFAFWILRFLLTADYDVFHSHTFSTSAFLPLVRLRGKRVGITVHGQGQSVFSGGLLNQTPIPKFLQWLILRIWPFNFRLSASRLPNFVFVGNGVDPAEFRNLKKLPHRGFVVLCISRPDPVKGVAILKKAIKQLPGVKLHLVSGRRRTVRDFARSDIYVLPSLSEGFPVVLLEAMAAKLPIVATDVGDCRKLVQKANCGLIVKPGSSSKLAAAIKTMMADKNRARMGERGRDYVAKNFTWAKVAAYYNSAYRRTSSVV